MINAQCDAHFVLLGLNYTMKKTCLSCNASHFDESYASPGPNGKKYVFLPRGVEGKAKKTLFSAAPSLVCATLDQCKNWGPVNWSPVRSPGTSCCQGNIGPLTSRRKHAVNWIRVNIWGNISMFVNISDIRSQSKDNAEHRWLS